MSEIDMRFSSLGFLTYQFELKFKKVLLILETMDDPELLFTITCFLDIDELLSLLSTCKKFNRLRNSPIIEVRILKQKIKFLQSPKQAFNGLNLLPGYYQFLLQQKQEDKEVPKNAEAFFKNFKELKKTQDVFNKRKQLALRSKSQEVTKILEGEKLYQLKVSKIQKQIEQEGKIYKPAELAKQPYKKNEQSKSYVEKFRKQYLKIKEFERQKNIQELEELHQKESGKIRIKGEIETPFKKIPIIEIKSDEKLSVVKADTLYVTKASRLLHRVKTILGLNVYY